MLLETDCCPRELDSCIATTLDAFEWPNLNIKCRSRWWSHDNYGRYSPCRLGMLRSISNAPRQRLSPLAMATATALRLGIPITIAMVMAMDVKSNGCSIFSAESLSAWRHRKSWHSISLYRPSHRKCLHQQSIFPLCWKLCLKLTVQLIQIH